MYVNDFCHLCTNYIHHMIGHDPHILRLQGFGLTTSILSLSLMFAPSQTINANFANAKPFVSQIHASHKQPCWHNICDIQWKSCLKWLCLTKSIPLSKWMTPMSVVFRYQQLYILKSSLRSNDRIKWNGNCNKLTLAGSAAIGFQRRRPVLLSDLWSINSTRWQGPQRTTNMRENLWTRGQVPYNTSPKKNAIKGKESTQPTDII